MLYGMCPWCNNTRAFDKVFIRQYKNPSINCSECGEELVFGRICGDTVELIGGNRRTYSTPPRGLAINNDRQMEYIMNIDPWTEPLLPRQWANIPGYVNRTGHTAHGGNTYVYRVSLHDGRFHWIPAYENVVNTNTALPRADETPGIIGVVEETTQNNEYATIRINNTYDPWRAVRESEDRIRERYNRYIQDKERADQFLENYSRKRNFEDKYYGEYTK